MFELILQHRFKKKKVKIAKNNQKLGAKKTKVKITF